MSARFKVPPGWPVPPPGWTPPDGWRPDPSWPPAPPDWIFWVDDGVDGAGASDPYPTADTLPPADHPLPLAPPPKDVAPTAAPPPASVTDPPINHDRETDVESLRERVADLEAQLRKQAASADESTGVIELNDERVLQEVGIYRYHHPLENAVEFRARLSEVQEGIKHCVKQGRAVLENASLNWPHPTP